MENAEEVSPVNTVEEQTAAPVEDVEVQVAEEQIAEEQANESAEPTGEQTAEEQANESAEPTEEEQAKLRDMEAQRDVLNNDAEKHRIRRDELNAKTKDWKASEKIGIFAGVYS